MEVVIVTDEDIKSHMLDRAQVLGELMDASIRKLNDTYQFTEDATWDSFQSFYVSNVELFTARIMQGFEMAQCGKNKTYNLMPIKVNESHVKLVNFTTEAAYIVSEIIGYDQVMVDDSGYSWAYNWIAIGNSQENQS